MKVDETDAPEAETARAEAATAAAIPTEAARATADLEETTPETEALADPATAIPTETTADPAETDLKTATDSGQAAPEAATGRQHPLRIVLAKLGLDGHDRGIKVVARMLRDAGFEVIYLGLRQTTESVLAAAEQEDADAIGLSIHNGGHMTLAPRMVNAVRGAGMDVPVIVGGIVPAVDVPLLLDAGVAAVLGPGASADEVSNTIRSAAGAAATAEPAAPTKTDDKIRSPAASTGPTRTDDTTNAAVTAPAKTDD